MEEPETISVRVKYKNIEQEFTGSIEHTWLLLNKLFLDIIPKLKIANNLWLSTDLAELSKDLEGIVAYSPEGLSLMIQKNRLTDNETIILWLLGRYLGQKLGLLPTHSLSREDLQESLGKSGKITSTRLGELVKMGFVSKTSEEKYAITTIGIVQTQKGSRPKVRTKTKT